MLYRNVHEGFGGAAERFVFAEYKGEVAPDLRIREFDRDQRFSSYIFFNIRARNKPDADTGRHKALQQFARIEFHGKVGLQVMVIEQGIERITSVAKFGHDQWICRNLNHGNAFLRGERMMRSSNHDKFIAMNHLRFEPVVGHRQGNDAKVDYIFEDCIENSGVVRPLDIHGDIRIVALKLRKHLWQNMEAGAFIGSHNNFAAGHTLGFGNLVEDGLAALQCFFGVLEEQFAGRSK